MSDTCRTVLLNDDPTLEDAFGSHKRVADAIADLVLNEKGGKSIALTGSWGSGKSTVVELLKETLSRRTDGKQARVFVFDAWSHEGDPLRRSFLERLICFLCSEEMPWIENRAEWTKKRDALSKRLKETETSQSPHLTWQGALLALAALLVPIGSAVAKLSDKGTGWPVWLAVVLAGAPFVISLVFVLWLQCKNRRSRRACCNDQRENDLLPLLVSQHKTEIRSKTSETPDPTSVEFQRLFEDAMKEALLDKGKRRLIVVIDNLDRVDPTDALSIWSTMRTFFDSDGKNDPPWRSRFWLLVPFDPDALARLWDNEAKGACRNDSSGAREDRTAENADVSGTRTLYESFVKKTFQVEFRVSAPLLSDWEQFFLEQLDTALPQHSETPDRYPVYRAFRYSKSSEGRPITPREIKLFINEVGALHRQWCGQIPLECLALYALHRAIIESNPQSIIGNKFLPPHFLGLVRHQESAATFAALHYGVPTDRAMEVVLIPLLEKAFLAGDLEDLKSCKGVPGLRAQVDQYIEQEHEKWATEEPATIARAAKAVCEVESEHERWGEAWQLLVKAACATKVWNDLDRDLGEGIAAIARHAPETDTLALAETLCIAMCADAQVQGRDSEQSEPSFVTNWVEGAVPVLLELSSRGCQSVLKSHFKVPGSAATYLTAIRCLAQEADCDKLVGLFTPSASRSEIMHELAGMVSIADFAEYGDDLVETLLKIRGIWKWDELVDRVESRLHPNNCTGAREVSAVLRPLLLLMCRGDVESARSAVERLCAQGYLMHHLHSVRKDAHASALCMIAHLMVYPDGNTNGSPRDAGAGLQLYIERLSCKEPEPQLVERLSTLSIEFGCWHLPCDAYSQTDQARELASRILGVTASRPDVASIVRPEDVLERYDVISKLIDDEGLRQLTKTLVAVAGLIEKLAGASFDGALERLYFFAYTESTGMQREVLRELLIHGLQNLSKDRWAAQLTEHRYLLRLLLLIQNENIEPNLGGSFQDALFGHAKDVIHGASVTPDPELADSWPSLPHALNANDQIIFVKNLWEEINTCLSDSARCEMPDIIRMYGPFLLASDIPTGLHDRIARLAAPGLLERGSQEEVEWLVKLLEAKPDIIKHADATSIKALRNRAGERERQQPDTDMGRNLRRAIQAIDGGKYKERSRRSSV